MEEEEEEEDEEKEGERGFGGRVSMAWRNKALADIARHVQGCHLALETKVRTRGDNVGQWAGQL